MEGLKIPIVHDSQMSLTMLINEDSKTVLQNKAKAMAIGATFSSDVGKSAVQTLGSGVGFAAGAIGAGGVLLRGSILFGGPFVLGGAALVTAMSIVGGLGSSILGGAAVTMAHMAPNILSEHAGYIHHNYTADDLPDGMAAYSQIQDNADIPSAADLSAEMKRRTEKGQANTCSLKTLANSALKAHCNQYMQAKDAAAKVLGLDFTNSWTEWLVSLACPVKSEAIHPLKYQHVGGSYGAHRCLSQFLDDACSTTHEIETNQGKEVKFVFAESGNLDLQYTDADEKKHQLRGYQTLEGEHDVFINRQLAPWFCGSAGDITKGLNGKTWGNDFYKPQYDPEYERPYRHSRWTKRKKISIPKKANAQHMPTRLTETQHISCMMESCFELHLEVRFCKCLMRRCFQA